MLKDKVLGCIVGGAVGDALGYPIEFNSYTDIVKHFGNQGVIEYVYDKGLISDDTQMILFTIEGLLKENDGKYPFEEMKICNDNIYESYLGWLSTQMLPYSQRKEFKNYDEDSVLLNTEELYDLRAPGNTCLSALSSGKKGTVDNPINNSKGCGGVMRVAPIGVYFKPNTYNNAFVSLIAGFASAITHGNQLGYLPAAVLACIINKILYYNTSLKDAVVESVMVVDKIYNHPSEMRVLRELLNDAFRLAENDKDDYKNITELSGHKFNGGGWVAEETLAIAVYCALKYENDFEKAVVAAVNHDGDSDSTGAVTGNIVGAIVGYNNIPKRYIERLELRNLIEEMTLKLI